MRVPHGRMGVPVKRVGVSNGWARAPDRSIGVPGEGVGVLDR